MSADAVGGGAENDGNAFEMEGRGVSEDCIRFITHCSIVDAVLVTDVISDHFLFKVDDEAAEDDKVAVSESAG